jgi:hypothetical protein
MPDRLWFGARVVGVDTMAMDQEYQRHLQGWISFGRLLRWAVGLIILTLILMAYFLL